MIKQKLYGICYNLKLDLQDNCDRLLNKIFGTDAGVSLIPVGQSNNELKLVVKIGERESLIYISKNMWQAIGKRAGWM